MTDPAWHDDAEVNDGSVVTVQYTSFHCDVSRGSPLIEVGRTTAHGEGDGFVSEGWGVGLFGTRMEHTVQQKQ